MKIFNYELTGVPLLVVLLNVITTTAEKHHKITRRSPLEIGYIVGVTSPDASHHHIVHHHIVDLHDDKTHNHVITLHPVIIHHEVLPTTAHGNSLVVVAAKTKIIPAIKTDTHVITHDVVVHDHPVVVHDTHVVIHDVKPHVLHETHVISHDTKSSAGNPVVHDVVLIPIGHGHVVTLKHHDVSDENPLRAHPGGYGVGVDFGGHGAGHGFYVNQNNNLF